MICLFPRLMVAVRIGRSVWMIFFDAHTGAGLCFAGDRERGEHDGSVSP